MLAIKENMTIPPEKLTFLAMRLFKSRTEVVHGIRYYLLTCKCVRYQKILKNGELPDPLFFRYRDPLDGACDSCGSSQEKIEQFSSKIQPSQSGPWIILRGDLDKETIIQVNERYQKVITSIISLSTGFLAFTWAFFQDIRHLQNNTTRNAPISSWILLGTTIFFCLAYFYCSAKFIKTVAGLEESQGWCKNSEKLCDYSFGFALFSFALAIIFFIIYAICN